MSETLSCGVVIADQSSGHVSPVDGRAWYPRATTPIAVVVPRFRIRT
jgi:hypothetical protein